MGISGQSLGIGLLLFPPLGEYLIGALGWRNAWIALGALVIVIMLPLGWPLFRDKPEQYGLYPDGDSVRQSAATPAHTVELEDNWTLAEARRSIAFWIFMAAFTIITVVMAGVVFHHFSIFAERGLSRTTAVTAFSVTAIFTILGNIIMGRLLDTMSARRLLSGTLGAAGGYAHAGPIYDDAAPKLSLCSHLGVGGRVASA